jgi:PAS domain S-box-containing protein
VNPERAEEALAREMLHNTGNLVLLKDADGRYLFVNRQFEKTFHVRQEEVKGKTDDEIFRLNRRPRFGQTTYLVVQAAVPMESKRQRSRTMAHIRPSCGNFP